MPVATLTMLEPPSKKTTIEASFVTPKKVGELRQWKIEAFKALKVQPIKDPELSTYLSESLIIIEYKHASLIIDRKATYRYSGRSINA